MHARTRTIATAIAAVGGVAIAAAGLAIGLTPPADGGQPHGEAHDSSSAEHETAASVTPEQQARADELIAGTAAAITRFADPAAAEASGYQWIGDGAEPGAYRHFVHPRFIMDPAVLDPATIESLVYRTEADGSLTLVSGMYILPPTESMEDVPDVAGDLTTWHEHADLCWSSDGSVAGTTELGECPAGSIAITTPPMLHVWVVENPAGPFAGIDGHGDQF